MQVNPSSLDILVAPSAHHSQEGGTASGGGSYAVNVCFAAWKEAPPAPPKASTGACPIHPRIQYLLEEFPELVWPPSVALQPLHGVVHHILNTGRPVFVMPGAWSLPCGGCSKKSLPPWKKQDLSLAARGCRCTWCQRRTAPCGRVATITASTPSRSQTHTLSQPDRPLRQHGQQHSLLQD
jgi:hypothetical protein